MRPGPILVSLALTVALAAPALSNDRRMPRDRTVRGALDSGVQTHSMPNPLQFLLPDMMQPGTASRPVARPHTDNGLSALHARNRYGTSLTCIGADCASITPTPISPKDRAILMQRGITATPPGAPVFQRPPTND